MYRKPEWVQYMEDMKEALKGNFDLFLKNSLQKNLNINRPKPSIPIHPPPIHLTCLLLYLCQDVSICFYVCLAATEQCASTLLTVFSVCL